MAKVRALRPDGKNALSKAIFRRVGIEMKKPAIVVLLIFGLLAFVTACGSTTSSTTVSTSSTSTAVSNTSTTQAQTVGIQAVQLTPNDITPSVQSSASGILTLLPTDQGLYFQLTVQNLEKESITSAGVYLPEGFTLPAVSTGTTSGTSSTSGSATTTAMAGTTQSSTATNGTGVGTQPGEMIIDLLAGTTGTASSSTSDDTTSTTGTASITPTPPSLPQAQGTVLAEGYLTDANLTGSLKQVAGQDKLSGIDLWVYLVSLGIPSLYAQVDTKTYPNGELRGTIDLTAWGQDVVPPGEE